MTLKGTEKMKEAYFSVSIEYTKYQKHSHSHTCFYTIIVWQTLTKITRNKTPKCILFAMRCNDQLPKRVIVEVIIRN